MEDQTSLVAQLLVAFLFLLATCLLRYSLLTFPTLRLTGWQSDGGPDVARGPVSLCRRAVDDGDRRVAGDDRSQSVASPRHRDHHRRHSVTLVITDQRDRILEKGARGGRDGGNCRRLEL